MLYEIYSMSLANHN